MTSNQRTASGLPFIGRPETTVIERITFFAIRHWRWTGIPAAIALTAGSLTCSVIVATWLLADDPVRSGYIGFLFTIPLIVFLLWRAATIELRAAPVWMIRAALASATDDERAFLLERMLQLATSEWRIDPISCIVLFYLFKEARMNFGELNGPKHDRLMAQRQKQLSALQKVAIRHETNR